MSGFTVDDLKNFLKNIAIETECPICLNTLKPPCSQCVNGHVVCCECRPKLNSDCPTCKQAFSETKSRVLDNILQLLPPTCKFIRCQELVEPGSDHELWCGYQPTSCGFRDCDWTGTGKTVLEHVKTVHDKWTVHTVESIKTHFTIKKNLSNDPCSAILAAQLPKYFLWIHYKNDAEKHIFSLEVRLVPNGKPKSPILITLRVGYEDKRSFSTSAVLTNEFVDKKVQLLTLPSSDVQQLIKDNILPIEYRIGEKIDSLSLFIFNK